MSLGSNQADRDVFASVDERRAARATARRRQRHAARVRAQSAELAHIDRCGLCGAWRYAGRCSTPHRQ